MRSTGLAARAALTSLLALLPSVAFAAPGDADFREWPMRNNYSAQVTSAPCSLYGDPIENVHCNESNPEAVDLAMSSGSGVYASTAGFVSSTGTNSCVGKWLVVAETDSPEGEQTYMTYQHLADNTLIGAGHHVSPGELIAYSGNSGTCTNGAHLHFMRASVFPTWSSSNIPYARTMYPIDGDATIVDDDLGGPAYESSNVGVGYLNGNSRSSQDSLFEAAWRTLGGWPTVGRPIGHDLQPCGGTVWGWRYSCSLGVWNGVAQGFIEPNGTYRRVIARVSTYSGAFVVPDLFLQYWLLGTNDDTIGFPVSDILACLPEDLTCGGQDYTRQLFQNGEIRGYFGCWVGVWLNRYGAKTAPMSDATILYPGTCSGDWLTNSYYMYHHYYNI